MKRELVLIEVDQADMRELLACAHELTSGVLVRLEGGDGVAAEDLAQATRLLSAFERVSRALAPVQAVPQVKRQGGRCATGAA